MRDFFADIDWDRWAEEIWTSGVRILAVVIIIFIALRILDRVVKPAVRAAVSAQMEDQPVIEIEKRVDTLSNVIYRTAWVVGLLIGLLTILPEFGINTNALIASAGLVGIAVGFGAQSLVRDIISGIFILMENQFAEGDVIRTGEVSGVVEDVNLRRTLLRDLSGAVHSVPNGEITIASNLTRTRSRVDLVVGVSYGDDIDHVFEVINRVGREMAEDEEWKDHIIGAPTALGVDDFGDSSVDIRVNGETQPRQQWDVMREFRRRLKRAFDQEGIEIPYPHRTLVSAGQKAADGLLVRHPESETESSGTPS